MRFIYIVCLVFKIFILEHLKMISFWSKHVMFLKNNKGVVTDGNYAYLCDYVGARGGLFGWGTALLAGRSRVRFPMFVLEFFIDIILPTALWPCGSTRPSTEMSTKNISWGWMRPVRKADNLTIFMRRMFGNLGVLTSWNPQGLPMTVQGLLRLCDYTYTAGWLT